MNLKIFCVPLGNSIKIEQVFKQVYEQVKDVLRNVYEQVKGVLRNVYEQGKGVLRNVCCKNLDLTQGLYRIKPVPVLRNTFRETVAWLTCSGDSSIS